MYQDTGGSGLYRAGGDERQFKRQADKLVGHLVRSWCTHDKRDEDGEQHQLDFHGDHIIGYNTYIFFCVFF